jgi:hypothetical protein
LPKTLPKSVKKYLFLTELNLVIFLKSLFNFKVDSIVYEQNLKENEIILKQLKVNLAQIRGKIFKEKLNLITLNNKVTEKIKKVYLTFFKIFY